MCLGYQQLHLYFSPIMEVIQEVEEIQVEIMEDLQAEVHLEEMAVLVEGVAQEVEVLQVGAIIVEAVDPLQEEEIAIRAVEITEEDQMGTQELLVVDNHLFQIIHKLIV